MCWLAIGVGLGAAVLRFAPPTYESSAHLPVPRFDAAAVGLPATAGLPHEAPSTHALLLVSSPVLSEALRDPAVAGDTTSDTQAESVRSLRTKLGVAVSSTGYGVSLSYRGDDPEATAALVTAVTHAYYRRLGLAVEGAQGIDAGPSDGQADLDAEAAAVALAERVAEAQERAELATTRLAHGRIAGRDIGRLQRLLTEAEADPLTRDLHALAAIKQRLGLLDARLGAMPASWGPGHRLRAPVELERAAASAEYEAAEQAVIQQSLDMLESASLRAAMEHAQLEAELETAGTGPVPVRVIPPPTVETRKTSPRPGVTLGVATLLGLLFGVFFALSAELRHPAASSAPTAPHIEASTFPAPLLMHGREDLERAEAVGGIPLLGVVPAMAPDGRQAAKRSTSTAFSIHEIRAVLQILANNGVSNSFAFTSPRRGAGKTSVTVGVASSLAVSGSRTLVIDCDLAGRIDRGQTGQPAELHPLEHQAPPPMGTTPHAVGIVGMLEGGSLDDCVIQSTVEGLWLLPASGAEPRHIELMSDRFIRSVLEAAKGRYDIVLFDTGPVPGSVEALLVTSQVDGVVVVVPHGETGQALERTVSYLKVVSAKVVGTVFNQVHPKAGRAGPSYGDATGSPTPADLADDLGQEIDEAMGQVPMGSGILAAAIFADENIAFAHDPGPSADGAGQDADVRVSVDEILPPE